MRCKKKRYTIGVLVGGIRDEFTRYICKGIFQQARMLDVNIVVFPGKYIDRDLSDNRNLAYEYQYSTIFSYAKKENVDALIIAAGSIGCFTTEDRIREMLEQYTGIPCILAATKIDGYANVVYDNFQGIKEGMEYLIEKKGYTKFGMIGGSEENSDARERKETFIKILKAHNLPFKESMFQEGDLSRRCTGAFRRLLEQNPGIQAIFCVNDETAMGLYEELRLQGIQVGKEISVFGYDDTIVSTKAAPPLSSVRADPGKLGQEAVSLALKIIAKEDVKQNIVVPTRFVKRDSFCHSEEEEGGRIQIRVDCEDSFNDIYYHYCHEEMQEKMNRLRKSYKKLLDAMTSTPEEDEDSLKRYISITMAMEEFVKNGGVKYADTDKLLTVLEELYRWLRQSQMDEGEKYRLRDIFSLIYIKIIRAMTAEIGYMQEEKNKENDALRIFVQDILQFEKGRDRSYRTLLENLDWLNVKNAGLYMLPKPILHLFREPFTAPEYVELKAVLKDGIAYTVPAQQQKKKLSHLFNNSMMPCEERYDRVVLPLFFNEMLYGIMLCDMTEELYNYGELLVNQLSSAAKMIALLRANEKIQQQLEDNLVMLRNHNIELDTISKSDPLTGILNRRGFYAEAEKKYVECQQAEQKVLVIYADMNNLKIINDRYGHDEGDFSLKLIGEFLGNLVRGRGYAGRIGGDEYACVLEYTGGGDGSDIVEELYQWFESFNSISDKEYVITISAGTCLVCSTDNLSLKEAMQQADEKLYIQKQFRKKEVMKKNLNLPVPREKA